MQGAGWITRGLTIGIVAVALVAAAPAAADVVRCAGPARADAAGTPELLTGCGRLDLSLGAGNLARRALDRLAPALGVDPSDFSVADAARGPAGRTVRLQQRLGGVPVFNGQIVLGVSDGGALRWVRSSATGDSPASLRPRVSAADALSAAARATGGGALRLAATTDLVVYPRGAESVLAWHVVLPTLAPADWNVIVDATSGAPIASWDAIADANSASIYDPSPVQAAGTYTGFADGNDADTAALTAARTTGFPLTHLNPSVDTLRGDFANLTGGSIDGPLPYTPGAAHSATRDYNFTRSDDRFEEASTYASINGAQSLIQSLGFTNANNRSIPIDVHYYSIDNSFYSSADHGLHFGDGGVDDAEDADIVLHEYGHSIQDNQVPGFGPASDTEQRAIGEGFGDFLAAIYYSNRGNATYQSTRRYCVGDWDAVSYNPFSGANNGSGCLRWTDGTDESGGADIGQYPGTPSEEHNDGRYWSAAMTCIFEGLGGNAQARSDVIRLVIAHNALLVPDDSDNAFEDSVAALRVADQNLSGGIHIGLINNCAFARRLINTLPPSDTTPPQVQPVVSPAAPDGANGFYRGNVSVNWQVSDPESSVTTSGCDPVTIVTDTPGTTLTCTATSAGGVTSQSATLKRDATAPETEITSGPKAKTKKAKATFAFTSSDPGASFECALDGKPFGPCSSPTTVRVKKGKHELEVRAVDQAGNADASPDRQSWKRKKKKRRRRH